MMTTHPKRRGSGSDEEPETGVLDRSAVRAVVWTGIAGDAVGVGLFGRRALTTRPRLQGGQCGGVPFASFCC